VPSRQAEQASVITQSRGQARFRHGLRGAADDPGDHHQGTIGPGRGGLGRASQDRFVEARFANGKLRRVDADRETAGARVEIIAGECALPPLVETALLIERQQVRRNGQTARKSELASMISISPR